MSQEAKRVAIIGGGAFGTALACVSASAGHDTLVFVRDRDCADSINRDHQNPRRLPGIELPDRVRATTSLEDLADREIVLFAVPAQHTRTSAIQIAPVLAGATCVIACAKGLEQSTGFFQHQVLGEICKSIPVSALSGPSFAADIARTLPTALTIASESIEGANAIARIFSTPSFRLYSSSDLIGVETGGALKNVLAIGVGIVRGMGLGASAEAALIARGFAELQRLGQAMGAKRDTISGLSGLGDLVLTCSSPKSRNFSYGMAIGKKENLNDLPLAEGVHTAKTADELARKLEIDAPLISTISDILENKITPHEAVDLLLSRPLRSETG